jgi:glycosyltransferase involved in cell wall biosynthesis
VHNGIDLTHVPMGKTPGDYLLFVGRMSQDKGILDAIEIARGAGERLVVVAKINEPLEQRYFDEHVRPALASIDAEVLDQPSDELKLQLYAGAKATLFPIRWPEPFGLVMIESMAAGTPVIAFRNGSVPEVIRDGETGFICDSVEGAIEAVGRLGEISRERCREHVVTHFSAETAVARHEEVYRTILEHGTIAGERTTAADAPTAFAPAGGGVGTG